MTAVLQLDRVTKRYPGVTALDDVSLRIDAGELLAIVGPSGSGKSTLLQVMGTLDRPTRGRVLVEDRDAAAMGDRELAALRAGRIGFVFQQ
ncbi:MAG TPA: ATP-binding cassette domain-containing protein, partial [Conexibacter sp.]|nr:ATP-binding cassette domain-containing protein [Conexibacter sp.]